MASRIRFSINRAAMENSQKVLTEQELLIPHLPNGKIDWNTLGNMLTANIIGEVLCASYIDKKHRMATPPYAVDTEWKYEYEERDVVVLRKEIPNSPFHCWMGRAIIERPMKEIAEFLENPASAMIYDKHITESKHLEVLSESKTHKDVIAYYFTETRECLVTAKRDFLFYLRHAHTEDKYLLTALSVNYPQCPPLDGIPRAQLQPGTGWHLERHMGSNARTLVTYVVHTDLKSLPPIVANRVLKRQPLNILYAKNHLMSQHRQSPHATHIPPLPYTEEPTEHHHHRHQEKQQKRSEGGQHCEESPTITRTKKGDVKSHGIQSNSPSRDNHSTLDYTYCNETPVAIS